MASNPCNLSFPGDCSTFGHKITKPMFLELFTKRKKRKKQKTETETKKKKEEVRRKKTRKPKKKR
jgi:hypothetical protein